MLAALEASIREQRQLVADASHELRTPLTSVRTNIEVLGRDEDLPAHDRGQLIDEVVSQLEELTVLVADLVELARGKEETEAMEEVRLDLLVSDAVERAQRRSPQTHFVARVEPSLVTGVPARLDRAISNLLDNATKWNVDGQPVEVTVARGEVTVRDHGPGISQSDLPHVFDRFYRAPSARGLPGSGLGLAIVRQVAESHGGRVEAETVDGGGARLSLQLPTTS
jgi:two-component system sensor histidine kinase MprB